MILRILKCFHAMDIYMILNNNDEMIPCYGYSYDYPLLVFWSFTMDFKMMLYYGYSNNTILLIFKQSYTIHIKMILHNRYCNVPIPWIFYRYNAINSVCIFVCGIQHSINTCKQIASNKICKTKFINVFFVEKFQNWVR